MGRINRCVQVYLQLNDLRRGGGGGECEPIRWEPLFLPGDLPPLSPGLPSSPVCIWAKYVHAKVNSLSATHKLRMACLAQLPYMASAVFQSSSPFCQVYRAEDALLERAPSPTPPLAPPHLSPPPPVVL